MTREAEALFAQKESAHPDPKPSGLLGQIRHQILLVMSFDEDDALSARQIWRKINCWAEASIQNQLNLLVNEGVIKRKRQDLHAAPGQYRSLYWKAKPMGDLKR